MRSNLIGDESAVTGSAGQAPASTPPLPEEENRTVRKQIISAIPSNLPLRGRIASKIMSEVVAPRLSALQAELAEWRETFTDEAGTTWRRPTAEAYAKACAALHKHRERADALQAENAALRAERDDALSRLSALQERVERAEKAPRIEFHQHDWIPGFAAFHPGATTPAPDSRAFCALNLGSMLATVQAGAVPATDLPYFIAESMMHEVIHAIEQWAGVEFSEDRVEALLSKYAEAIADEAARPSSPTTGGDA